MSIELKYSWSESRIKTLRECMRKYYYNYYVSWEGWQKNAPQIKKDAYLLKNMTNRHMWVGSIVHQIIEDVVKSFRKNKTWITIQDAKNMGLELLRSGWKSSTNKEWQQNPKSVNLFEHFYNESITEEEIQKCKIKVMTCIENFYNSKLINIIEQLKNEDWISLEDFQSFKMDDGSEVSVKIDLGFKYNNKIYLIDYKTGKYNSSVVEQLTVYGMYSLKKNFTNKISNIIIVPVYLMSNDFVELSIDKKRILDQALIIKNESKILARVHENRDNEDFFEMTSDTNKCRFCQFKKICPGSKR